MRTVEKEIQNIHCKIFEPKEEIQKVLIAIHGFCGDCDSSVVASLANGLDGQGVVVLCFDLPCHGKDKKTAELRVEDCFGYISEIIKFAKQKYSETQVSFFATSFGAYLLLNYIGKFGADFEKIILRAPAIYMYDVLVSKILKEQGYSNADIHQRSIELGYERKVLCDKVFLNELKNNNLENFYFSRHIDIIQGDKDDVVDIRDNEKFFKKHLKNYSLNYIRGADHRFKNDGEVDKIVSICKNVLNNQ